AAAVQGGVKPTPNRECQACVVAACCDTLEKCSKEPACVVATDCDRDCLGDTECIHTCHKTVGLVTGSTAADVTACILRACLSTCLPAPECLTVGTCCRNVPKASPVYDACVGAASEGKAPACQVFLDLHAEYCPV